jgi:hypothetical protein
MNAAQLVSDQQGRTKQPLSVEELRTANPDEQNLLWLFLYRGYVQFEHEQVIERELASFPGRPPTGGLD